MERNPYHDIRRPTVPNEFAMKNILRILLNLHSLRMFARTLTLSQLEDIYRKLSIVVDEARKLELNEQMELKRKQAQLADATIRIAETGLDTEDIISALSKHAPKKRKPRPAKYKYVDGWGKNRTWTGQGRMPNVIQKAIKSGNKTLEDFSI